MSIVLLPVYTIPVCRMSAHSWANLPVWILGREHLFFFLSKSYPPVRPDLSRHGSFVWLCILFAISLSLLPFEILFILWDLKLEGVTLNHWAPRCCIQSLSKTHCFLMFTQLSPWVTEIPETGNWVFLIHLVLQPRPGLILADIQWLFLLWDEMELD